MAGMKMEGFQGLIPRTSDRLLPPMNAAEARNTKLISGEIRGFRQPQVDSDLTGKVSTLRRAFRVPAANVTETFTDNNIIFRADWDGADLATSYTELARSEPGVFGGTARLTTTDPAFGTAALDMNGASSYVSFGTDAADWAAYQLASTDDVTVQGFVKFSGIPLSSGPYGLISARGQDFVNFETFMGHDGFGNFTLGGRFGFGGIPESPTFTLTPNVWYHFAVQRRYNGGSPIVDLFWNGTRLASVASANNPSSGTEEPILVGAIVRNGTTIEFNHPGDFDNMIVTKRAAYGDVDTYTVPTEQFGTTYDVVRNPEQWICFDSRDVDIVRSPLVNDGFDRYYWAGDGAPKMNTATRIGDGDPAFLLGIPAPASAPSVTPPGGTDETRAYVYTFESAYGEEGPPSPPTLATGDSGTWTIGSLPSSPPDAAERNITKINIYRTVPGNIATNFFFVAEVPIGTTSYADSETNETVASNNLLETTTFVPPPSDLEGWVVMPNGYLVGWVGRRLLFSEPYRPHAWPAEYELATEFDIVGLGVVGSTLVICTESQPYFGQGVSPASFTTQKVDTVEPCLSRRSIVTTRAGVLYASINGLVLANSSGVNVVTDDLFTKAEWADLNPQNIYAANLGLQYIAFNSPNFGFIIDPENPMQRHVELDNFSDVEGIETDRYSGNVLLLSQNRVYEWDPEVSNRLQWRWKSKVYQSPKPLNFGAGRVQFDFGETSQALPIETVFRPYNEALFAAINSEPGVRARLAPLGGQVLGGSPAKPATGLVTTTLIETHQPLGGSLLYNLGFLQLTTLSVRFRAIVRPNSKAEKVVFDKQLLNEEIFRMPTGFKSDLWQFELIGNTTVYSVQIAETPNQLAEL